MSASLAGVLWCWRCLEVCGTRVGGGGLGFFAGGRWLRAQGFSHVPRVGMVGELLAYRAVGSGKAKEGWGENIDTSDSLGL